MDKPFSQEAFSFWRKNPLSLHFSIVNHYHIRLPHAKRTESFPRHIKVDTFIRRSVRNTCCPLKKYSHLARSAPCRNSYPPLNTWKLDSRLGGWAPSQFRRHGTGHTFTGGRTTTNTAYTSRHQRIPASIGPISIRDEPLMDTRRTPGTKLISLFLLRVYTRMTTYIVSRVSIHQHYLLILIPSTILLLDCTWSSALHQLKIHIHRQFVHN